MVRRKRGPRLLPRTEFVLVREEVASLFAQGYSRKAVWDDFKERGVYSAPYKTFCTHCKQAGLAPASLKQTRTKSAPQNARPTESKKQNPTGNHHHLAGLDGWTTPQ